jgi:hypothetical protein
MPAQSGQALGTLVVSVQVLPVCSSVVDHTKAVVRCPPDYPFSVTRVQPGQAASDGAQDKPQSQVVTIRY